MTGARQRGIDHLVLCTRDLDRMREAYGSFGFTTTPRAVHPFGTGNSLIQLQGNFLELLTVVDESKFSAPAPGRFEFGAFAKSYLDRREGMAMLVFEGHDAIGDHAEFSARELDTYEPFHFERQATLPDGKSVTVGFSLVFATSPAMPEAVFFTCQQHAPEYFWKPEYQTHANGARVVSEVVMVADQPAELAGFLGKLQEPDAVSIEGDRVRVATARGRVTVLTPERFAVRFGAPTPGPENPHFAAYRVSVADLGATERLLADNGVAYRRAGDAIQIDAATAFGIVLEFAADT